MIRLQDLAGAWRLTREIEDQRFGLTGHLEGRALWLPDGEGLRQEESGILRFGEAAPMQATRVYLWRQRAGRLVVLFEDGRPFHDFQPGEGAAAAPHDCPPDRYHVTYDFADWPDWSSLWRVTGPRKDAVIISRFVREEPAASN